MKLQYTALLLAGLMASQAMAQDAKPAAPSVSVTPVAPAVPPMPDLQKLSYAIGMNWGELLKQNFPEAKLDSVTEAMKDAISGKQPQLTEAEARELLKQFTQVAQARQMEKARLTAEKNKSEGEAYMAKNGKEAGVVTLPSGIQYKIIAEGSGATPKSNDTVVVNYRGTTIDGKEFDSSYAPDRKPLTTPVVGRTIKGWSEVLQLMKVGSKWQVTIPANLAYGPMGKRGQPGSKQPGIEPNSTLIFEMELLSIQEPVATAAADSAQVVSGEIIRVPSQEEIKKGAKVERVTLPTTNSPSEK